MDLTTLPQTKLPKTEPAKIIGVISDTHIPTRTTALPKTIAEAFQNVDYIIHAGDLTELTVIDELEQIAPVLAVQGNMDTGTAKEFLPKTNQLKIMNWTIGVTHDPAAAYGTSNLREIAKQNNLDVIIFGHTHTAGIKWEDKKLYLNPGSPTDPQPPFLSKPTVAILKITKEAIIPEIIDL
jgi:uncharacterized protein